MFDNIDTNKRNGNDENRSSFIFDELLYKQRFIIGRTNVWIDASKALFVRFKTKNIHCISLNITAFTASYYGNFK